MKKRCESSHRQFSLYTGVPLPELPDSFFKGGFGLRGFKSLHKLLPFWLFSQRPLLLLHDFLHLTSLKSLLPMHIYKPFLQVVRKELRDISKLKILHLPEGKMAKLRLALLALYDHLTAGRSYPLDEAMVKVADEYFATYLEEGGKEDFNELENDFEIVACASHKQVDVVISEERKTMLRREALRAYEKVNARLCLRMPNFYSVDQFKKELKLLSQKEKSGGVGLD